MGLRHLIISAALPKKGTVVETNPIVIVLRPAAGVIPWGGQLLRLLATGEMPCNTTTNGLVLSVSQSVWL
jgi:hypothetical protein